MRAMMVANENVEHGFANGSVGRIVHWGPEPEHAAADRKRTYRANYPDMQARFYLEEAYQSQKQHFLPEVDFMDLVPRRESVPAARGQPLMLQFAAAANVLPDDP